MQRLFDARNAQRDRRVVVFVVQFVSARFKKICRNNTVSNTGSDSFEFARLASSQHLSEVSPIIKTSIENSVPAMQEELHIRIMQISQSK